MPEISKIQTIIDFPPPDIQNLPFEGNRNELAVLYRISESLKNFVNVQESLDITLEILMREMRLEETRIVLLEDRIDLRYTLSVMDRDSGVVNKFHEALKQLTEHVELWDIEGNYLIEKLTQRLIFSEQELQKLATYFFFPLTVEEDVFGVMMVRKTIGEKRLSRDQQEVLRIIAETIARAIAIRSALDREESLQHYNQLLLDSISDGVMTVDLYGIIKTVNPAMLNILECDAASVLEQPCDRIFARNTTLSQLFSRSMGTRQELIEPDYELEFTDGRVKYLELRIFPLIQNELVGAAAVMRDVTNERILAKMMYQTQKLTVLGELAAVTAHEINNPLFGIINYLEVVLMDESIQGQSREYLGVARDELNRLGKIVKNLSGMSRDTKVALQETYLNDVVQQAVLIVSPKAEKAQIQIIEEYTEELPLITVDAGQLEQVFINLLLNAVQSFPAPGVTHPQIKVSTKTQRRKMKPYVCIHIEDNGCGIPVAIQEKVFEPFYTTRQEAGGSGLGLSVSQNIIYNHGGRIVFQSQEGNGTTFIVELPLD
ncbi:MAG: PAS domain S-box protein [Gemmatimonadetes bacterium]|nr:MAG: PAS domain S-box protein [Gemmatimonadota bacterium]